MNVVLIYSGGLDSTVLLYTLLKAKHKVYALSVNYGQKHSKELEFARQHCAKNNVFHEIINLDCIQPLIDQSSLTNSDIDVPAGHYEEENMKSTVVPNRNMLLLSLATSWAINLKADAIAYAAHSGDHAIYPDCREDFIQAIEKAIQLADWHSVKLLRPFVNLDKTEIVRRSALLEIDLQTTWSCYQGREKHCGCCGTCIERREAIYLAGFNDPTEYESDAPSIETLIENNWRLSPC